MNSSRSCLRRLFGRLSLGMMNRSRWGTWSPISCISPSTTHHSDFTSPFAAAATARWPRDNGPMRPHRRCWCWRKADDCRLTSPRSMDTKKELGVENAAPVAVEPCLQAWLGGSGMQVYGWGGNNPVGEGSACSYSVTNRFCPSHVQAELDLR